MISLSSNIKNSKGIVILFRFTQKTGLSTCLFTVGHTLTFNRVLRLTLVNQILMNRR
jgi:hypothetical protein